MMQNIFPKNYNSCCKQANTLYIGKACNQELSFPRLNTNNSLNNKKRVSFNPIVNIIEVESWKKYNCDMSNETEYMQLKRELMELKAQNLIERKKNNGDCNCNIF